MLQKHLLNCMPFGYIEIRFGNIWDCEKFPKSFKKKVLLLLSVTLGLLFFYLGGTSACLPEAHSLGQEGDQVIAATAALCPLAMATFSA